MGEETHPSRIEKPISHGICHSCAERLWGEEGTQLQKFLASLGVPALLVDKAGKVQLVNQDLLEMAHKTREDVEGRFNGEVFDCWNADQPGGCGFTVKCSACVVRRTVLDTYDSGAGRARVPVTLKVRKNGVGRDVDFLLTTEKAGDRVLVRIDPPEVGEGANEE